MWTYKNASEILYQRILNATSYFNENPSIVDELYEAVIPYRHKNTKFLVVALSHLDELYIIIDIEAKTIRVTFSEEVVYHYAVYMEIFSKIVDNLIDSFQIEHIQTISEVFNFMQKEKPQ